MSNIEKLQRFNTPELVRLFLLYLALIALIFPSTIFAAGHPCENASIGLRGDLDVVSSGGGIWTLMEQKGLKKEYIGQGTFLIPKRKVDIYGETFSLKTNQECWLVTTYQPAFPREH